MENKPNISSEEELLHLRNEGKISEAEYQELLATLRKAPPHGTGASGRPESYPFGLKERLGQRDIPPVLWIALVSLAVMILIKLLLVFKFGPLVLIDAALSTALLVGLYLGQKWAYILTIVFVVLGTLLALSKSPGAGLGVFIINCLVLIPVVICTDFYFPKSPHTDEE